MSNPWEGLSRLTKKRVKEVQQHNLHWIVDNLNKPGLMIQCKESSFTEEHAIKLKGIVVMLDTCSSPNTLILLLNDVKDMEIFEVLCKDLISLAEVNRISEDMISQIVLRLLRWKKLLQQEIKNSFSLQKQMGLYGELTFIKEVLKDQIGLEEAIENWYGPSFEKQDFVLENAVAEVKTYKTANERIVEISSKDQLYTPKEYLYLATYAISENKVGHTVKDLIDEIIDGVSHYTLKEKFLNKVENYGYFPELINEPLVSFIVDESSYYKVEKEFPRFTPNDLATGIKKLNYSIDLLTCELYRVEKENLKF